MNIKTLITIALTIIGISGATALIFLLYGKPDNSWKQNHDPKVLKNIEDIPIIVPTEDTENNRPPTTGKLFLTLAPNEPNAESFIATMDAGSGKIQKIPVSGLTLNDEELIYGARTSPDKTQIAFATTNFRNQTSNIFTAPIQGGNAVRWNIAPIYSFTSLSVPQWQGDSSLIFGYRKSAPIFDNQRELEKYKKNIDMLRVDETSQITRITRNGGMSKLANGFFPHLYAKTDTILYSLGDGLYFHNIKKGSTRSVVVIVSDNKPIPAAANKKLSLSPDGKTLAWSNFEQGELYIFKTYNDGVTFEPYARYPTAGFWTVFSPDGKYLALQTAEIDENSHIPKNPSVIIYDLENHSIVAKHNLYKYNQGVMWLTDWVD